jgi:hypothetical protein
MTEISFATSKAASCAGLFWLKLASSFGLALLIASTEACQ